MILEGNYITIQGWMRTALNLKGNDLLIYALIYGYCQDNQSKFTGSQNYVAEWCGLSKSAVNERLKNLVNKGLLHKEEKTLNNVKFCSYSTNVKTDIQTDIPDRKQVCPQTGNRSAPRPETRLNNNKNRSNKKKDHSEVLKKIYFPKNLEVDKAFKDYLGMRIELKYTLTDRAINTLINKLRRYTGSDPEKAIEIIENAIVGEWQSFFPLKV